MEYSRTLQYMTESKRSERKIRLLEDVHPLYMLPDDPFVEEILIPGFRVADKVSCMVGFFSSQVLASLAPGLATYIAGSKNSFRLIISPLLSAQDKAAIEEGISSVECVVERIVEELIITEDLLQNHTLKCLSWLLREHKIEIKVALMKDALFHPKVWLFTSHDHVVAAHGSSNVTNAGIRRNVEQIAISRSWQDSNQRYTTEKLRISFEDLWEDNQDNCIVIDIPDAIRKRLIHSYNSESPPTENELKRLYERAGDFSNESTSPYAQRDQPVQFTIPNWLEYKSGPFKHQGKAVAAWCDSGYRGVLEMATGSGKTITSMIGACHLYQEKRPLLIVIAVPYLPLVEQWCDEVTTFGLKPVNLSTLGNAKKRGRELQRLRRQLRFDLSDVEVVVVSHDTLCTPRFLADVEEFDCSRLLIADEVHNLGRQSFIYNPPDFFDYRL
ncbi:MAG: DEAD/DEAH box helicase [Rhodothermaceae bacterium]|nr:DEAD/DEAH box helicase [Rhodothermaceae bacterium]